MKRKELEQLAKELAIEIADPRNGCWGMDDNESFYVVYKPLLDLLTAKLGKKKKKDKK